MNIATQAQHLEGIICLFPSISLTLSLSDCGYNCPQRQPGEPPPPAPPQSQPRPSTAPSPAASRTTFLPQPIQVLSERDSNVSMKSIKIYRQE